MAIKKNKDIKGIKLKVAEAQQDDVNKGIVRIDSVLLKKIGLKPGNYVMIKGKRETVAIADRAYPGDIGLGIIRMDGLLRRNAGTAVGEQVLVYPAQVKEAKIVTIAPTREGVIIKGGNEIIKRGLLGRAVIQGDLISLGGTKRRKATLSENPLFDEVFQILDETLRGGFLFGDLKFIVTNTNPSGPVVITDNTEIEILSEPVSAEKQQIPDITYEDIGGLDEEIKKIREMVELPLKHPEIFERLGIEPPKGVLLYGPPGTGKTLLAKAVANETNANFLLINGPEIMSKFYGQSEENLRKKFEEAEKNAPSIIFIDEIDAIAPKREESKGEVERRVVAQLLALMDGLKPRQKVIVIAATNIPNAIDPALRRPGRFDREIEIGVPNRDARLEILKIHTRGMPLDKDVNLEELADITHGFVGADLAALCKEAAMNVLRRLLPQILLDKEEPLSEKDLEKMVVTRKDFMDALKVVRPSAMREVLIDIPKVKWEDIGGLEKVKQELREAVEWPLKKKDKFKQMGITPPKGVLLYGPPGTGKTLLAKAVANEANANFIAIRGPELLSKWVGESEKAVREVFRKARQVAPAIIFFDEIDSLVPRRGMRNDSEVTERVVNQLLTEMDGIQEIGDVLVIAATNRPDMIDPALLRPGRFDRIIYTPVPDKKTRLEIFKVHTQKMPLDKDVNLEELAEKTEGYVGSDIEGVCREAGMLAIREDKDKVEMKHFEEALKKIPPSVTKEIEKTYKELSKYFSRARAEELKKEAPSYFG